jgi:adenine deaminase
MHLENSAIASRRDIEVADGLPPSVLHLVLFDPAGRWRSRTLLSGFANDLGGLASSFAAAAGIYTLGRSPADMAAAAARVLDLGGGIVLVEDGAIRFELPLPLGGIMSGRPLREIAAAIESLTGLLRTRGYRHGDLPSSLLFFGFDSLPYIRLTYRGLWDVLQNQPLLPREDLAR